MSDVEKSHKEKLAEARVKWLDKPRKPNAKPTGRNEIRTSDPILRELFLIAYRDKIFNAEISKRLNISTVAISRWKKGVSTPSMLDVIMFARALGYEITLSKKH